MPEERRKKKKYCPSSLPRSDDKLASIGLETAFFSPPPGNRKPSNDRVPHTTSPPNTRTDRRNRRTMNRCGLRLTHSAGAARAPTTSNPTHHPRPSGLTSCKRRVLCPVPQCARRNFRAFIRKPSEQYYLILPPSQSDS